MILDLLFLGIIGCVIEVVGIYAFNKMIYASMITSAVSLLIMFVATTRWGIKGLILAPFLALATVLSGRFLIHITEEINFRSNYDWRLYIAITCSLLSFAINSLWFKKISHKETFKYKGKMMLLVVIDILVSQIVLSFVYLVLRRTFLILGFATWNMFSFIIFIVGAFVLSGQNVLVNIKENLLEVEQFKKEEEVSFNFDDVEEGEEK